MSAKVEKAPQLSNNDVRWAISEDELREQNIPIPKIVDSRHLSLSIEGKEVAVGILALPPKEPSTSAFWTKILQKTHLSSGKNKLSPTQLRIEPQIDFDDAKKGLHTPLSVLHPYVIMEDGTRYGIGIRVPKEWTGKWSEPKERPGNGMFFYHNRTTEVYRQKNGVALLIRLDGITPLAESRTDSGIKGLELSRTEMFIGFSESEDESSPNAVTLVSHRQVLHPKNYPEPDLGEKQKEKADVCDLEFHVVAQRGTEKNATFDDKGLVEVIVARCVMDEVIEKITKPQVISNDPLDSPFVLRSSFYLDMTPESDEKSSTPDSTLKGETKFTNERREKVQIESAKDIKPVARFKLALVGPGGPITKSMTEVPESTH
jgi:hypothetical protein